MKKEINKLKHIVTLLAFFSFTDNSCANHARANPVSPEELDELRGFIMAGKTLKYEDTPEGKSMIEQSQMMVDRYFSTYPQLLKISKSDLPKDFRRAMETLYAGLLGDYQIAYEYHHTELMKSFEKTEDVFEKAEKILQPISNIFRRLSTLWLRKIGISEKDGIKIIKQEGNPISFVMLYTLEANNLYSSAVYKHLEEVGDLCLHTYNNPSGLNHVRGSILDTSTLQVRKSPGIYIRFVPETKLNPFANYQIIRQVSSNLQTHPLYVYAAPGAVLPSILEEIVAMPEFQKHRNIFIPDPSPKEQREAEKEFLLMIKESNDPDLQAKVAHLMTALSKVHRSTPGAAASSDALAASSSASDVLINLGEDGPIKNLSALEDVVPVKKPQSPQSVIEKRIAELEEEIRREQEEIRDLVAGDDVPALRKKKNKGNKGEGKKSGKPKHRYAEAASGSGSAAAAAAAAESNFSSAAAASSLNAPSREGAMSWRIFNKILINTVRAMDPDVTFGTKGDHLVIHGREGTYATLLRGGESLPGFLAERYFNKAVKNLFGE